MLLIAIWTIVYSVVVAFSILLLGNPATLLGHLNLRNLLMLLLDWQFLLGGVLALVARFIFVIINNLASKEEALAGAHLTITAIATTASIVFVIIINHFLIGDELKLVQIFGVAIVLLGLFFVFK